MSRDLKLVWNNDLSEADLKYDYDAGDLYYDEGLETAVIISLFTDQRAKNDDTLPDENSDDKRGWWGDQISDIENDEIGSRIWLHAERAKTVEEVLIQVKQDVKNALQWLITDGVAAALEITTERQTNTSGLEILAMEVKIKRRNGNTIAYRFDENWLAQINDN